MPIEIQKNDIAETKYKKDSVYICHKCGEKMYESEMGKASTLMGDGYYPSKCPKCGAESLLFGNIYKLTDEFRMVKCEWTTAKYTPEKPNVRGEVQYETIRNKLFQMRKKEAYTER